MVLVEVNGWRVIPRTWRHNTYIVGTTPSCTAKMSQAESEVRITWTIPIAHPVTEPVKIITAAVWSISFSIDGTVLASSSRIVIAGKCHLHLVAIASIHRFAYLSVCNTETKLLISCDSNSGRWANWKHWVKSDKLYTDFKYADDSSKYYSDEQAHDCSTNSQRLWWLCSARVWTSSWRNRRRGFLVFLCACT